MKTRNAKYCRRCGERLSEGGAVCPNCGAEATADAPDRGPSHRGRNAAIAAGIAAVVVLALAVGWLLSSRLTGSPVTKFISYHTALFSERVQAPLEKLASLRPPGELNADVTVTASVGNSDLAAYLDSSSITLRADVRQDSALLGAEIDLLGSTVLNGTVTYENGRLGIYLPELDRNYYVTDLAPAIEDATGREPDLSGAPLPRVSLDGLAAAARPYWDAVTALISEQNITRDKNVSGLMHALTVDGPCQVYAFRPTEDSLQALILALADLLEQDGGLRSVARELLTSAAVQLSAGGLDVGNAEQTLDEALDRAAGFIRENAASIAGSLAGAGFTWSIAVEDGAVRQVSLSVLDAGTQTRSGLAYETASSEEDTLDEVLCLFDGEAVRQIYTRHSVRADGAASGAVRLTAGDTSLLSLDYAAVDGRLSPLGVPYGSFTLRAAGLDAGVCLAVRDSDGGGTDHVLSLSGIDGYSSGLFDDASLTVNAVEGSTVQPPAVEPVDVSGYSREQIEDIVTRMGRTLRNDLLANLWPLLRHVW